MTGYTFDTPIVLDVLVGHQPARGELQRVLAQGGRPWVSRLTWTEILSQADPDSMAEVELFMSGFAVDEIDEEIASRAAALMRERSGLGLLDATVLATAMTRGRVLVTRNIKDFPAQMPGIRIPYTL